MWTKLSLIRNSAVEGTNVQNVCKLSICTFLKRKDIVNEFWKLLIF